MEYSLLKNGRCLSCDGQIGYFPDSGRFRCLSCNRSYNRGPSILKNEECPHCKGEIGYFKDPENFQCIRCGEVYDPSGEKGAEARRRFWASPKGREIQAAYFKTEKGRKAQKHYQLETVKGKLSGRRYYYSDKGQAAHKKHQDKVKLFKAVDIYLKENPDKTIQDALLALEDSREPTEETNSDE